MKKPPKPKSKLNQVADQYMNMPKEKKGDIEGSPSEEASESPKEEIEEDGPEAAKKPKKSLGKKKPFQKSM